jgi:molecular chaperone GrpE
MSEEAKDHQPKEPRADGAEDQARAEHIDSPESQAAADEIPGGETPLGGSATGGSASEEGGSADGPREDPFDFEALDAALASEELTRIRGERDSYLEALQRLQADFENYRKRVARQQAELGAQAVRSFMTRLLPALDALALALAHALSEAGSEELASTLGQINSVFAEILAKEGLEVIEPIGKRFDPEEAEAVAHEEGEGEPIVSEVYRVGYRWQGQTLRPAMVKVTGS